MHKLQPVRGTKDLMFDEYRQFAAVVKAAKAISGRFGYEGIATPIFEFLDVFQKGLGESSDVVGKEMYIFEDRGGEKMTLRPEFTAGIVRSVISNGLQQNMPLKCFSYGPVFRYERPQKGRQRQFHQLNFEAFGEASATADIEILSLAHLLTKELGIADKLTLEVNSLGDTQSRQDYRALLVEYLQDYKDTLSEDSQKRLVSNPMRILDSKDKGDQDILVNAPKIAQSYSAEAADFFAAVQEGLSALAIDFQVKPSLVRGLDYYCHTAFEFTTDQLGAQNAVFAGGRYDGLVEMMGGSPTPAIGFAGGIERIMALMETVPEKARPVVLVPIGEAAIEAVVSLAYHLRREAFYVECLTKGNVGKRMKKAGNLHAAHVVIFGDDDLKAGSYQVKNYDSGEETTVAEQGLVAALKGE